MSLSKKMDGGGEVSYVLSTLYTRNEINLDSDFCENTGVLSRSSTYRGVRVRNFIRTSTLGLH